MSPVTPEGEYLIHHIPTHPLSRACIRRRQAPRCCRCRSAKACDFSERENTAEQDLHLGITKSLAYNPPRAGETGDWRAEPSTAAAMPPKRRADDLFIPDDNDPNYYDELSADTDDEEDVKPGMTKNQMVLKGALSPPRHINLSLKSIHGDYPVSPIHLNVTLEE